MASTSAAASSASTTTTGTAPRDDELTAALAELKGIAQRDAALSPEVQLARLTNEATKHTSLLNPYEVLQLPFEASESDIKKTYRALSLLVHPDKHADNPQAHEAFEVVNKAYKSLTDPEQATKLKIIVSEAKLMAAEELKRRRKPPTAASAQQQHQILSSGVAILPGEADEVILDKMARAHATLLFVDLDRKRKEHDAREALNKKRARELELEMEESRKKLLLSKQAMDDSRDDRVASWRTFVETGKKSGKTSTGAAKSVSKGFGRGMRPPKLQPEARTEFSLRQQQASDQLHGGPTE